MKLNYYIISIEYIQTPNNYIKEGKNRFTKKQHGLLLDQFFNEHIQLIIIL